MGREKEREREREREKEIERVRACTREGSIPGLYHWKYH